MSADAEDGDGPGCRELIVATSGQCRGLAGREAEPADLEAAGEGLPEDHQPVGGDRGQQEPARRMGESEQAAVVGAQLEQARLEAFRPTRPGPGVPDADGQTATGVQVSGGRIPAQFAVLGAVTPHLQVVAGVVIPEVIWSRPDCREPGYGRPGSRPAPVANLSRPGPSRDRYRKRGRRWWPAAFRKSGSLSRMWPRSKPLPSSALFKSISARAAPVPRARSSGAGRAWSR